MHKQIYQQLLVVIASARAKGTGPKGQGPTRACSYHSELLVYLFNYFWVFFNILYLINYLTCLIIYWSIILSSIICYFLCLIIATFLLLFSCFLVFFSCFRFLCFLFDPPTCKSKAACEFSEKLIKIEVLQLREC